MRYEVKAPVDGFDIELVFMDNGVYNTQEREWLRDAADRWERIITEGLPDETYFVSNPQVFSLGTEQTVTVRGRVDDLRIYVYAVNEPESRFWARGGAKWFRWGSWLPSVASVAFNEPNIDAIKRNNGFYSTALHEIGHCLGFHDWFWTPERLDLIRLPSKNYPGAPRPTTIPRQIASPTCTTSSSAHSSPIAELPFAIPSHPALRRSPVPPLDGDRPHTTQNL